MGQSSFSHRPLLPISPERARLDISPGTVAKESDMRLCLVEDHAVAGLEPLTLTRTAYDLRLGATTLGAKLARALKVGPGPARRGAIVRPFLAAIQQERDPRTAVNDTEWLSRGPVLVVNSRWVAPEPL